MCSKSPSLFLVAGLPNDSEWGQQMAFSMVEIWHSGAERLRLDPADHLRTAVQDQQIDGHVLALSRAGPNRETVAVPSGAR